LREPSDRDRQRPSIWQVPEVLRQDMRSVVCPTVAVRSTNLGRQAQSCCPWRVRLPGVCSDEIDPPDWITAKYQGNAWPSASNSRASEAQAGSPDAQTVLNIPNGAQLARPGRFPPDRDALKGLLVGEKRVDFRDLCQAHLRRHRRATILTFTQSQRSSSSNDTIRLPQVAPNLPLPCVPCSPRLTRRTRPCSARAWPASPGARPPRD